jgi:16S rRNA processing protein RimM
MGRVAGAYGVRGWIKVAPGGGAGEGLVAAKEWWIGDEHYEVAEARMHSGSVVAQLAGITDRDRALALKGAGIEVERAALPEPGQGHYYLVDLIGLQVVNEQGEPLGEVKGWITNGAQDVMQIGGERPRLIPWVSAIVKEVDLAGRRVVVDWGADW